jgi:hypothetical protein
LGGWFNIALTPTTQSFESIMRGDPGRGNTNPSPVTIEPPRELLSRREILLLEKLVSEGDTTFGVLLSGDDAESLRRAKP